MKAAFKARPSADVVLAHGEESITLTIRPPPLGYGTFVRAAYPAPTVSYNGKPPVLDTAKEGGYESDIAIIVLAAAMGDAIEVKAPATGATPAMWSAYAKAIREEMEAANLIDGDLMTLMRGLGALQQGQSATGKS